MTEQHFVEVESFREAIQPYASGRNCRLQYDNGMSALRAHLYIQSEDDRPAVEEVVREFQHIVGFAHIYLRLPRNCIPTQLEGFNFPAYEKHLGHSLESAIAELASVEPAEYYSLFVLLDPGNNLVSIGASSKAWLESQLAAKESKRDDKAGAVRFAYFERWETTIELNDAASKLLREHERTINESYDLYGEQYLSQMSPSYDYWTIEYTAKAMSSVLKRLDTLNKTDDFVFFISLYDEPVQLQEFAWRRIVPPSLLKRVFGPVRDEYQKDA